MTRRFSKVVPKSELELERFYLDTINKLEGTSTTLADEDQKSMIPFLSMVHESNRKIELLKQENTRLRAQITRMEHRLTVIEKEIL